MRTEQDNLGSLELPEDCIWGVHTQRALHNFQISDRRVPGTLIAALAIVKRAAAQTNHELGFLPDDIAGAIDRACARIIAGGPECRDWFPLDALQGGAGTSTNMNVNEVIANLALKELGKKPGDYEAVHQIEHVNLHQSTNDVYPTAVRVAAIGELRTLADAFAGLQGVLQDKESAFASVVKMGRTEMQPAVPMTLGQEFSGFAEAVARDRWRTFKCEERLRIVNLGGTAIGTGLTAPRDYIFRVIEVLRSLTGMGLSRNENPVDGTSNNDAFVEVSGILKAASVNLSKIAADLRLLHTLGEISLPPLQAGSSIMPGKVNPVMMEGVMQVGMTVRANDAIVSECAAQGTLQINEFMPLLAASLLESITLLKNAALALAEHVRDVTVDPHHCRKCIEDSPALITAFLPEIGYERAEKLIEEYQSVKQDNPSLRLKEFLAERLGEGTVEKVLTDGNLLKLGGGE